MAEDLVLLVAAIGIEELSGDGRAGQGRQAPGHQPQAQALRGVLGVQLPDKGVLQKHKF